MSSTAVVLVAHGSRLPAAADAHRSVCTALQARVGDDVVVSAAYLEITDPDIPAAIDAAVAGGADRVLVLPYFLHPGNHTRRDIPAAVEAARRRNPGATIDLADFFGADPALVSALAAQVGELVEP